MNGKVKGVSSRWLRAPVVALILSATGCSFVFVQSPPSAKERQERRGSGKGDCTTSRAAPIADTVIGGLQVVRTVYAVSADESAYEGAPITRDTDVALGVVLGTVFLSSAVYGYATTSECKEWKQGPYRTVGEGDAWAE